VRRREDAACIALRVRPSSMACLDFSAHWVKSSRCGKLYRSWQIVRAFRLFQFAKRLMIGKY
jgi:hypothetical protein